MSVVSRAWASSWLIVLPWRNIVYTDAGNFWVIWEGLRFFKLSRHRYEIAHGPLLLWEILLVQFKNKLNRMERTIKVKHAIHPNKYDAIVSLYSPNFEGSPLVLKPEGWSAISPGCKWGGGVPGELGPGPEAFCWVCGVARSSLQCWLSTLGTF